MELSTKNHQHIDVFLISVYTFVFQFEKKMKRWSMQLAEMKEVNTTTQF